MKKLLLSLLLAIGSVASAQTLGPGMFGGYPLQTGSATYNQNYIVGNYFTVGPVAIVPQTCYFYLYNGSQSGALLDCGIISAPTTTSEATSWLCHATYTETGGENASWITISLASAGCGTLAANSTWWLVTSTNHNSGQGTYNCGSSCSGNSTSGSFTSVYLSETYGTYTGNPTSFGGTNTYQNSQYLLANTDGSTQPGSIGIF